MAPDRRSIRQHARSRIGDDVPIAHVHAKTTVLSPSVCRPHPSLPLLGNHHAFTYRWSRRPRRPLRAGPASDARRLMSGASRARTGDLLSARQTLSQLSYGPVATQCIGEFEVLGPVDPPCLVVLGRNKSKLDSREPADSING